MFLVFSKHALYYHQEEPNKYGFISEVFDVYCPQSVHLFLSHSMMPPHSIVFFATSLMFQIEVIIDKAIWTKRTIYMKAEKYLVSRKRCCTSETQADKKARVVQCKTRHVSVPVGSKAFYWTVDFSMINMKSLEHWHMQYTPCNTDKKYSYIT